MYFFLCLLLCDFFAASSLEMNDIMKELSWPLKLKVLNQHSEQQEKIPHSKLDVKPDSGVKDPNSPFHLSAPEGDIQVQTATERAVGIELLREAQRRDNPKEEEDDDKNMRLKLFRLMYETVRDSDLKVKRAELIKDHYTNSSSFEIGYLIGDITDKSNIITDISMTLKRFHKEWKPIEHINAYEQIANQAIEITHLIDLVRVVNKKENDKN